MPVKTQTFATTSAFEILGPIMVGPSSSHTAGALRCARVAASLLDGRIVKVRFTLWNSFAHTYKGHGSDRALVAGILGWQTDDTRIINSHAIARELGLDFDFIIGGDDSTMHANTIDIAMTNEVGHTCKVRAESLGGGRIKIVRINGVAVSITGNHTTLFVCHKDVSGVLSALTGIFAEEKVNIAFLRSYRSEQGGLAYTVFEVDSSLKDSIVPRVKKIPNVEFANLITIPGSLSQNSPGKSAREIFDNGEQLLQVCEESGLSIGNVMKLREDHLTPRDKAAANMQYVLDVMRKESTENLYHPVRSLGGFIGGEAHKIAESGAKYAPLLMGNVLSNAVARAMSVIERSAGMGVIVAAPTAGSAGVVPGAVLGVADTIGATDDEVKDALWCAAAVGLNIQAAAGVAGAEGGCQAEVGSAAAMAAAAIVELLGGTPEQALAASALAVSNLLGLVCDPVGGLVEVPCQARNAIGVCAAVSSAQLVLSGISLFIPFDEVIRTMRKVGHSLPSSLRETAKGGLAITPSALAACAACGMCG